MWVLRSIAVTQPHYTSADIAELEGRLEKYLDGIQTAPELGWELCLEAAEFEQGGEAFCTAVTAFRSLEIEKIRVAVEIGFKNAETFKGLVSAFGWLPGKLIQPWIKKFFTSKDVRHKRLAVAACSVRRENPLEYLTRIFAREDCIENRALHIRSLRLVGELKRHDLIPSLEYARASDDDEIRFWALWSSILLGNRALAPELEPFVICPNVNQQRAIQLAFRCLAISKARDWITKLSADESQVRNVLKASGVLGDPQAIGWLITHMRNPKLARLAGEAFSLITGIDLEANQLVIEIPDLDEQLPDDEPGDDNVEMDEDENLPWPDADALTITWQKYGNKFVCGNRYFMGKAIGQEPLVTQLGNMTQRQLHEAAIEAALMNPSLVLSNTYKRVLDH